MENTVDDALSKQLHKMTTDIANFIALYEQADDHFKVQKEEMEQSLTNFKSEMQSEIKDIKKVLGEVREVMDAAGAARWRVAAEKALKSGGEHLTSIKEATNIYKKLAEDSITRLDNVSLSAEKRINGALNQLQQDNFTVVEQFRSRSEETYKELEETSINSINYLRKIMRWLRFDRITIAVIAALLSAFFTSSYVNAEWPWESHKVTTQERLVGKQILSVWPTLSKQRKNEINKILGTDV